MRAVTDQPRASWGIGNTGHGEGEEEQEVRGSPVCSRSAHDQNVLALGSGRVPARLGRVGIIGIN